MKRWTKSTIILQSYGQEMFTDSFSDALYGFMLLGCSLDLAYFLCLVV